MNLKLHPDTVSSILATLKYYSDTSEGNRELYEHFYEAVKIAEKFEERQVAFNKQLDELAKAQD